jgi:hypothetical protein
VEKVRIGELKFLKDSPDDLAAVEAVFAACDADGNGARHPGSPRVPDTAPRVVCAASPAIKTQARPPPTAGQLDMQEMIERYGKQAGHMLKEFDLDEGKTISKDEFVAVLDDKYQKDAVRTSSVAWSLRTTAHPFHTRFAIIFGAFASEATTRPNRRRGRRSG